MLAQLAGAGVELEGAKTDVVVRRDDLEGANILGHVSAACFGIVSQETTTAPSRVFQ
jgi:hypothetical protein